MDAVWDEGTDEVCRGLIVRKDHITSLLDTPVDLEFYLYQKLNGTSIPVPKALWLEKDAAWFGRPFFVMGRIDGALADPLTLASEGYAHLRQKMAHQMAQILADIHTLGWQAIGMDFLGEAPEPERCAERGSFLGEDRAKRSDGAAA